MTPALKPSFTAREAFAPGIGYRLLPFRFRRFDDERYLVTNDVGEYCLLAEADFRNFVAHRLPSGSGAYRDLKSKHFLFDDDCRVGLELLALKYRTRADRVSHLTGLHIFVVTLRCDHSCQYCQVSRQTEDRLAYDMTSAHADRALDLMFESPSPSLKVEFQGGEPLLNFEVIKHIVERAVALNGELNKVLDFVIASNLSQVDDGILDFCARYGVSFSTSLDGPEALHNMGRPNDQRDSYQRTIHGIKRVRAKLGHDAVSALMTTTPRSMPFIEDIIAEYVRQGFSSVFLRSLSPFGFAAKRRLLRHYSMDEWLTFYRRGLASVLEWNKSGTPLREEFSSILLQKMFSPSGTGYVDLQSPAGLGIGALVYNYDGSIYASDEGRMLSEMGDESLRLGHVNDASFESIVTGDKLVALLDETLLESAPMCSDCAYLPFCGSDPAFHIATSKDALGHKATSAFCKKQTGALTHLLTLLEDDHEARDILLSWV